MTLQKMNMTLPKMKMTLTKWNRPNQNKKRLNQNEKYLTLGNCQSILSIPTCFLYNDVVNGSKCHWHQLVVPLILSVERSWENSH